MRPTGALWWRDEDGALRIVSAADFGADEFQATDWGTDNPDKDEPAPKDGGAATVDGLNPNAGSGFMVWVMDGGASGNPPGGSSNGGPAPTNPPPDNTNNSSGSGGSGGGSGGGGSGGGGSGGGGSGGGSGGGGSGGGGSGGGGSGGGGSGGGGSGGGGSGGGSGGGGSGGGGNPDTGTCVASYHLAAQAARDTGYVTSHITAQVYLNGDATNSKTGQVCTPDDASVAATSSAGDFPSGTSYGGGGWGDEVIVPPNICGGQTVSATISNGTGSASLGPVSVNIPCFTGIDPETQCYYLNNARSSNVILNGSLLWKDCAPFTGCYQGYYYKDGLDEPEFHWVETLLWKRCAPYTGCYNGGWYDDGVFKNGNFWASDGFYHSDCDLFSGCDDASGRWFVGGVQMPENYMHFEDVLLRDCIPYTGLYEGCYYVDGVLGQGSENGKNYDGCDILGCMNPGATNYKADATKDDGSCLVPGCMDSNNCGYNADATVEGDCPICGCMTPEDPNYNPAATHDDGSCSSYPCPGGTPSCTSFCDQCYCCPPSDPSGGSGGGPGTPPSCPCPTGQVNLAAETSGCDCGCPNGGVWDDVLQVCIG
ncbi:MAG: hypothetical protein WCO60_18310 [Verrucomicrobiota bacterium]